MPGARVRQLGLVLAAYTKVCRLVGLELDADEGSVAWALDTAASAAGAPLPEYSVGRLLLVATSGQRMIAAAALREREGFDDTTMIAIVDAAARWLAEEDGGPYAYALLGAVTDELTQGRAYAALAVPRSRTGGR